MKMLIVDDEPIVGDRLRYSFEKEGFEVETFTDGGSAVRRLEEQGFDIIITDLKMRGVDGMQVLERAHALYPKALVVVITGFGSIETAVEAMKKGAFDYITKPFRLDDVKAVVRRATERLGWKASAVAAS
jgi:DNA-binding NtrC family response regulator